MIRTKIFPIKGKILLALLLLTAAPVATLLFKSQSAYADYNGGNLISNSVFLHSGAMSKNQVQSFLVSKGGQIANKSFNLDCDAAGQQAKQVYLSLGAPCGQNTLASHIIYYAAQVYGLNPQVILATLQKEQSLVTAPNPTARQYNQAMGYACPTSGSCDDDSSFFWQVDNGAWVLRFHFERARGNMSWWYNSNTWTCGSEKNYYKPSLYPNQDVRFYDQDGVHYRTHFIANAATSAFYCYTPHAYNNPQGLYGLPAYGTKGRYYTGSYNFVKFFELWFGPTVREKIITVTYDGSTDNSGEIATVGFRLSSKPSSNVVVPFAIALPENARIMGGQTEVVISPENWNNPKANRIQIAGLHNPNQEGTIHYKLDIRRPITTDQGYSNLPPSHYGDVFLVHQETDTNMPVHRVYNAGSGLNIFTANNIERDSLVASGWQDKGPAFSYCSAGEQTVLRVRKGDERKLVIENSALHTEALEEGFELESMSFAVSQQGSVPVYWFSNEDTGDHFYTTSSSPMIGYTANGAIFNACETGVKPAYRLYNRESRSYFYTTSPRERKDAIASGTFSKYEGVGFYTCTVGTDVHRLYRASSNSYVFVTSGADRDYLVANNKFTNEGVQFKLCADGQRDVYSLYNPAVGIHFYTTSQDEREDFVDNIGFRDHGVQFQAK